MEIGGLMYVDNSGSRWWKTGAKGDSFSAEPAQWRDGNFGGRQRKGGLRNFAASDSGYYADRYKNAVYGWDWAGFCGSQITAGSGNGNFFRIWWIWICEKGNGFRRFKLCAEAGGSCRVRKHAESSGGEIYRAEKRSAAQSVESGFAGKLFSFQIPLSGKCRSVK